MIIPFPYIYIHQQFAKGGEICAQAMRNDMVYLDIPVIKKAKHVFDVGMSKREGNEIRPLEKDEHPSGIHFKGQGQYFDLEGTLYMIENGARNAVPHSLYETNSHERPQNSLSTRYFTMRRPEIWDMESLRHEPMDKDTRIAGGQWYRHDYDRLHTEIVAKDDTARFDFIKAFRDYYEKAVIIDSQLAFPAPELMFFRDTNPGSSDAYIIGKYADVDREMYQPLSSLIGQESHPQIAQMLSYISVPLEELISHTQSRTPKP